MNENAKKWVAALRSGEYPQTAGSLRRVKPNAVRPTGYCCLGVACELYAKEHPSLRYSVYEEVYVEDSHLYSDFLPHSVRKWLGLSETNASFQDDASPTGGNSLVLLNDEGATFDKIADIIESEPKGLFE